jgi:GntR family transcriptional regulator
MFFKLSLQSGVPVYLQLIEQVRHATEIGSLEDGDQLPGIRSLAEELIISPNTVAKAYSQLEHEGLLELRHGSGAFIRVRRRRSVTDHIKEAGRAFGHVIQALRKQGLRDQEIRRAFEAELLADVEAEQRHE